LRGYCDLYGYAVAVSYEGGSSINMFVGGALGADGYVTFAGGYGGTLGVGSDVGSSTYCGACCGEYSVGEYDKKSVDRYIGVYCGCEDLLLLYILRKPLINIITKSAT